MFQGQLCSFLRGSDDRDVEVQLLNGWCREERREGRSELNTLPSHLNRSCCLTPLFIAFYRTAENQPYNYFLQGLPAPSEGPIPPPGETTPWGEIRVPLLVYKFTLAISAITPFEEGTWENLGKITHFFGWGHFNVLRYKM